jgi:hypothetical protein
MAALVVQPLSDATVRIVEAWFSEPETRARLGAPGWVSRLLTLTEGGYDQDVLARHAWTISDAGVVVGLVDVEVERDQCACR